MVFGPLGDDYCISLVSCRDKVLRTRAPVCFLAACLHVCISCRQHFQIVDGLDRVGFGYFREDSLDLDHLVITDPAVLQVPISKHPTAA